MIFNVMSGSAYMHIMIK